MLISNPLKKVQKSFHPKKSYTLRKTFAHRNKSLKLNFSVTFLLKTFFA
jgi:hypothetical protein